MRNQNIVRRGVDLLLLVFLLLPSVTNAELVARDLDTEGDAGLTFDTSSGLEWLDLTLTMGLSYNDVLESPYAQDRGFRLATVDEFYALCVAAGGVDVPGWSVGNVPAVDLLQELLGCTLYCTPSYIEHRAYGWIASDNPDSLSTGRIELSRYSMVVVGSLQALLRGTYSGDDAVAAYGAFLVRPEPGSAVAVEADSRVTKRAIELDAQPNPFNPRTRVSFVLDRDGPGILRVYDVKGRAIRTLFDGPMTKGLHEYDWDGRNNRGGAVGTGVYFARLEVGARTGTVSLVLLK